jgi:hypothetical protein
MRSPRVQSPVPDREDQDVRRPQHRRGAEQRAGRLGLCGGGRQQRKERIEIRPYDQTYRAHLGIEDLAR